MDFLKKHPFVIVAIAAVILLAFVQRQKSAASASTGDGTGVQFSGGGEIAPTIDPNVAAIMEAEIAARTSDFGTYAASVVGSQQSSDALAAAEAGDYSGLVSNLTSSNDNMTTSLASIAAQRDVAITQASDSLAAEEAQIQAELQSAEASVASAGGGGVTPGGTSYTSSIAQLLARNGIVLSSTYNGANGSAGYNSPQLLQYINELQLAHVLG